MLGRFKFEKLVKYPHMKPADVVIWERFIDAYEDIFDSVDYDVCVGEGADFLPTGEDTPDGRENRLYQKKIDVVGYADEEVMLIEVKREANMKALGQILAYYDMYLRMLERPRNVKKMVLAQSIDKDIKNVFFKNEIEVVIV